FQVEANAPEPSAQRDIGAFCRREAIPFLDLLPALGPLGEAGFLDYDHLSIAGADRVAEALAASDLLPKSPGEREILAAHFGRPVASVSLQELASALGAPDPRVRAASAWALEQEGEKAASTATLLRRALRDESP